MSDRLQRLLEALPTVQELRLAQAERLAEAAILKPLIAAAEAKERRERIEAVAVLPIRS
jgi:hypothetical protein